MKPHLALLTLGVFLVLQGAAHTVYAEEANEWKATIQRLQEENKGLQEQLNKHREILEQLLQKTDKPETPDKSPVEKATSPAPSVPPPKAVSHEEAPPATSAGHDEHLALQSFIPTLSLRGFGDVNFVATDERSGTKHGADTFALGQLDLFITSILSDALTFTSEIVFKFDSQTNEAAVTALRSCTSMANSLGREGMSYPMAQPNKTSRRERRTDIPCVIPSSCSPRAVPYSYRRPGARCKTTAVTPLGTLTNSTFLQRLPI